MGLILDSHAERLAEPYKIGKTLRAEVRLFSNTYFHRDLAHYHGEQMRVGYDIHDSSRVWVRDMEGRLICIASIQLYGGTLNGLAR